MGQAFGIEQKKMPSLTSKTLTSLDNSGTSKLVPYIDLCLQMSP